MKQSTLASMTEALNRPLQPRLWQRITWINGVAHVQVCPCAVRLEPGEARFDGGWDLAGYYDRREWRPGSWQRDGKILRRATPDDLKAMCDGRMSHDPETEPGRKAWQKHVDEGGD